MPEVRTTTSVNHYLAGIYDSLLITTIESIAHGPARASREPRPSLRHNEFLLLFPSVLKEA